MRFDLTAEQQQVLDMVRSLARESFAPKAAKIDEEVCYSKENRNQLAELGLLRVTTIYEGTSEIQRVVISRELLRRGAP